MKTKIFTCLVLCFMLIGNRAFAQLESDFDSEKLYYIKYKGFCLADDKTGLTDVGGYFEYSPDDLFTGEEYLRLKTFKENSWSQMWELKHEGDGFLIVNYSTLRSIWSGVQLPVIDTKWGEIWGDRVSQISLTKAYVGPTTGAEVGKNSWNKFKLLKDESTGKYSVQHVWTQPGNGWEGSMIPDAEANNATIGFNQNVIYSDFEIVEAASLDDIPDDADADDGSFIENVSIDNLFTISNRTISSMESFKVYNTMGELLSDKVKSFEAGNTGVYILVLNSNQKALKVCIK